MHYLLPAQVENCVSPPQLKFCKQARRCWISQMLYCFVFFQSVLDPIAHDYSQVQNCMHKQLQQQFTDCELNQPIVSTISCSLLIWKELGRWLPLQLASCGHLGLLVQSCTGRQCAKVMHARSLTLLTPAIWPDVHPRFFTCGWRL